MGRKKNFEKELAARLVGDDKTGTAKLRSDNAKRLNNYFGSGPKGPFDGSCFETYGRESSNPERIGPSDVVAVTLLSMEIRRGTSSGITPHQALRLEEHSEHIADLLTPIPTEVDLHKLSAEDFANYLGDKSYGERLWRLLRDDINLPKVATHKLLARKRPHLFPIKDSRAVKALGGSGNWWRNWYETLHGRPDLVSELERTRTAAASTWPAIADLSVLRVADIALWMK